ncbi:Gfo/Idh/MocA family oxidoreductase [bacterium]|nr:Gfo/Idh/MocA family oxidoreductase [bacterium]NIN92564.1 Gfo/Idh/MocA family oxidoreductase [bacterium]NIO18606.1 Gfo/Idh/MocA family oxidoreductase [bacterium]NIO73621.1 Gfo/Idh/MocA family oxidoreductase [bacterium]
MNVALIGAGYWGPNLARVFFELPGCNLHTICDKKRERLDSIKASFPNINTTQEYKSLLGSPELEAIAIATEAQYHYEIAREFLLAGKHVFVEKPLALNSKECEDLIDTAKAKNRVLMVGHLLEYHPAVAKLKELIDSGDLGKIYYIYSQRVNLGEIRRYENALWSFGPHDISVVLYLLGEEPESVNALGQSYLQENIQDVVFVNLHFKDKRMAQVHISWLDPHKIRKFTIVGSKKMAVFDDMESSEKIKIYDKGAESPGKYATYGESITLRIGDINIPKIDMKEPLKIEVQHFLECIRENKCPLSDGVDGLRVVRVLEAAQKSMENYGVLMKLEE